VLTNREKRFIKYWEDQRAGGKWRYLLLYIPAGTFVGTIVLSFLAAMFTYFEYSTLFRIAAASLVIVTVISFVSWQVNEKKFRTIIRREMEEGREAGEN
jgi:peptidoglycan/LPS O-acetylase OafA/YrhL